jgi:hypothetical protein
MADFDSPWKEAEDVRQLLRFIDWLMELPEALEREFEQELERYGGGTKNALHHQLGEARDKARHAADD